MNSINNNDDVLRGVNQSNQAYTEDDGENEDDELLAFANHPPPPPTNRAVSAQSLLGHRVRQKFYRRLDPRADCSLVTPHHIRARYPSPHVQHEVRGPINATGRHQMFSCILPNLPSVAICAFEDYPQIASGNAGMPNRTSSLTATSINNGAPQHATSSTTELYDPEPVRDDDNEDEHTNKPCHNQNSFITIFSLWNTMMGTSLLTMPWTLTQAGFSTGIALLIFVGLVTFYTAYRVIDSTSDLPPELYTRNKADFFDACEFYLGRIGKWTAICFSLLMLLGAMLVYYVLLTNFLYNTGEHIYTLSTKSNYSSKFVVHIFGYIYSDVLCKNMPGYPTRPASAANLSSSYLLADQSSSSTSAVATPDLGSLFSALLHSNTHTNHSVTPPQFFRLWNSTKTVPFWLLIIVFPLLLIKSPTFLSKFNALGTLSTGYIILFVVIKAFAWGFHLEFDSNDVHREIIQFSPKFVVLTGIASQAFFSHNIVHTIMRNQKNPKNNIRDLAIAYICVGLTYIIIAIIFYSAYPFAKQCIEENLLNNIPSFDMLAFIGRIFLFCQMITVFPLLMYITRVQFMQCAFGKPYPSFALVLLFQLALLTCSVLIAMFLPRIGTIIRFSGSFSGFFFMILLPCLVHIQKGRAVNNISVASILVHSVIILLGLANFLGQFAFL